MLIEALLVKLFADRQLAVAPEVVTYLTKRVERSFETLRRLVGLLDRESLARHRAVTLPLAREIVERENSVMPPILTLLRPHQWIKNAFVAAPLFFTPQLISWASLGNVALGVACFSAMSSAVYILNDWRDREVDRKHPDQAHSATRRRHGVGSAARLLWRWFWRSAVRRSSLLYAAARFCHRAGDLCRAEPRL